MTIDTAPTQAAMVRRFGLAMALVAGALGLLAAPPVLGPLLTADGTVEAGPLRLALWLAAMALAALGGLGALTWRAGLGWVAWSRRRWRSLAAALAMAVVLGGLALLALWRHHDLPDWRDAVALDHPALAPVAALLARGDATAAEAALVELVRTRPRPAGPWSMVATVGPGQNYAGQVAALRQGRLLLADGREAAWPETAPVPWDGFDAGSRFALHRGDLLMAALAGYDRDRDPALLGHLRRWFVHWGDPSWRHRSWPWPDQGVWGDDPGPNRTTMLIEVQDRLARARGLDQASARAFLTLLLRHRAALLDP